jgi:hypothetical protein
MDTTQLQQYATNYAPQVRLYPVSDPNQIYEPYAADLYLQQVQYYTGPAATAVPPPINPSQLDTTAGTPAYLQMPGATWQSNLTIRKGNYTQAKAYVHFLANPPGYAGGYDIQYWLFYAVRGFSAVRIHLYGFDSGFDLLASAQETMDQGLGEHQGDWKHVTVRIDQSGTMQGVFYAQHTGGYWLQPPDIPTVADGANNHPIVYSGRNTHSCLSSPGRYDQIGGGLSIPHFSCGLLETAADGGNTWNTWNTLEFVDTTNPAWLAYKGQWGPAERQGIAITAIVNQGIDELPWILHSLAHRFSDFIAEQLPTLIHRGQRSVATPSNQSPWTGGDDGFHAH